MAKKADNAQTIVLERKRDGTPITMTGVLRIRTSSIRLNTEGPGSVTFGIDVFEDQTHLDEFKAARLANRTKKRAKPEDPLPEDVPVPTPLKSNFRDITIFTRKPHDTWQPTDFAQVHPDVPRLWGAEPPEGGWTLPEWPHNIVEQVELLFRNTAGYKP